ncbi:MAG: hypothetical protein IJY96_08900, partial [Oscillospiraceae bacterium]|nr:hypothetical protein [Oscillospiraceae bacterium]
MSMKAIPKRSEVPVEHTWDLSHLFESDEAWLAEYEAQKEFPSRLTAFRGKLCTDPKALYEYMQLEDEMNVRIGRLHRYASCSCDQDTANSFYQDLISKARESHVAAFSASAFSNPEIMSIPDETLEQFFAEVPELELYRRPITKIRRMREHTGKAPTAAKYTRSRQVVALESVWTAADRAAASRLEYAIKKLPRPKKLELIADPACMAELLPKLNA